MAIVGYEWLIILAIIVVLFIWGPPKLREFARAIGETRRLVRSGGPPKAPEDDD